MAAAMNGEQSIADGSNSRRFLPFSHLVYKE